MNQVVSRITDVPFHGADMEKKFEIVKYIDPRFDCNNPAYIDTRYVVVSGGPMISRYQTKCDEFSNDMYRWGNRRTLGSKFLYESHWYIKYTAVVKINFRSAFNLDPASPDTQDMKSFLKDAIAWRPFPLTQATRSIQLKLNDKEISVLPRETLAARMEYWDPEALHKGCTTCPCERLNAQSIMQHGQNPLTDPFRQCASCRRGEKSNAMIAESQVDFHIGMNDPGGGGAVGGHDTCLLCGEQNANINLPSPGLAGNHLDANEFYYRARCVFYEPVLIEPLTFTNSAEFNPSMYNMDNFELTYNIDNLDNMIMLDKAKIMAIYGRGDPQGAVGPAAAGNGAHNTEAGKYAVAADTFINENTHWPAIRDSVTVTIEDRPELVYYVYTPIPGNEPRLPYMAPYKEFKRYRSDGDATRTDRRPLLDAYATNTVPTMRFDSGRIDMVYYPHSIYIYVAENFENRYSSKEARLTHADSFARIKKIRCTYGNCTTILDSFNELDYYNISLRNGLRDRSYCDWNMMCPSMSFPMGYSTTQRPGEAPNLPGIGSVVRLTPGIDLHTGGMTGRMIGGCPAVSKSISFVVEAEPLDIYFQGEKTYQLYIIFEQQGALVMQDGQCRVGLIGCESVEWYDMQSLAQITCDYNMYGSEIGGGSIWGKARKIIKKGWNYGKKALQTAAEHNMFSRGLNALGELTGNERFNQYAGYAKKAEGFIPKKKVAIMEPNAPPAAPAAAGSGYRRRFYH